MSARKRHASEQPTKSALSESQEVIQITNPQRETRNAQRETRISA